MARIFINSIPKSGTYRIASLLEHAGMQVTGLHLTETQVWDYAATDIELARKNPDLALLSNYTPAQALQDTARQDHQVLVGHFGFSIGGCKLLEPYTTLFLIRDLREVIVSWCRWQAFSGQNPDLAAIDDPREMVARLMTNSAVHVARIILSLLPWRYYLPPQHIFRNEQMSEPESIQELLETCGLQLDSAAIAALLQRVTQHNTLTRVPGQCQLAECWSATSEQHFRQQRLHEVNALLGYPKDYHR
ncbi:MAG: hypothetical protein PF630_05195 [Gammaproteobacteria bacterium]|nr:hypothetical protein [Gammaproteobacteria bacterium]